MVGKLFVPMAQHPCPAIFIFLSLIFMGARILVHMDGTSEKAFSVSYLYCVEMQSIDPYKLPTSILLYTLNECKGKGGSVGAKLTQIHTHFLWIYHSYRNRGFLHTKESLV